jgi:Mrp family chromosome partitioning ATPase
VAEIERWQAQAAHDAFISQREIPTDFGRSLLEMRLQDNGLQALRNEVIKRIEELNQVIAGLEDKHPARKPAVDEIKALTQRLQMQEAEFDRKTFENFRLRLVATLNQKVQVEQEIRKTLMQMEGQAAEFARRFQETMKLTREIREREQRLQQIQDRLNYLDTERNALGFVRLVTPALPAETPMGPGKTKLLLLVIVAAFGLALAAPVGLDILDRRIRSVNEAEKLMGIPSAGWQIRKEDLPTRLFAEEQTRRFAATLIRNRTRNERNVFAFTSVKSGGGATSTVLDAARTLAQLGSRVLVVEPSAFAPFIGFDGLQPGLSDFLAGKAELAALPQPYVHQDCTLAVVGSGAERSSGLQRIDLINKAVGEWSVDYDYLLFDLPPILISADAEMLVEALGQVFLVVEAEAVTRGEVIRAKRLLEKIDPEAVGLFVNNVPLFHGGGYMQEVIVETLTREKFSRFKSVVNWKLQWELLRIRWTMRRKGNREAPSPDQTS